MEKEFVPYELAAKLKDLRFDEECFGAWHNSNFLDLWAREGDYSYAVKAPLWQQVFDWFREKQNLESSVYWSNNYKDYRFSVDNLTKIPNEGDLISMESKTFNTYEAARRACLDKLIELATK